jgi:hypothetical protein
MSGFDVGRLIGSAGSDVAMQVGRWEREFPTLDGSPRLEIVAFDVPEEIRAELEMWAGHPNNTANDRRRTAQAGEGGQ